MPAQPLYTPAQRVRLVLAAIVAGALLVSLAGCEAAKPTDRTDAQITRTAGHIDTAATDVTDALTINQQMQSKLESLRKTGGAK